MVVNRDTMTYLHNKNQPHFLFTSNKIRKQKFVQISLLKADIFINNYLYINYNLIHIYFISAYFFLHRHNSSKAKTRFYLLYFTIFTIYNIHFQFIGKFVNKNVYRNYSIILFNEVDQKQ